MWVVCASYVRDTASVRSPRLLNNFAHLSLQMKAGEIEFIRKMNELEIKKAKELGEIEARA